MISIQDSHIYSEIAAARARHLEQHDLAHDDNHADGSIARAAAAYALEASGSDVALEVYPWTNRGWLKKPAREKLLDAAAMIVAEIARIDRAAHDRR